ncbi:matrixin family metalloprotease [Lactobacillus sp. ESL0785]|uniref:matrixin family metalloprotease n=1 Tax=Lactobacillus sp. ESL0785 TaxID=2983232 RepID=UPI0023F9D0CD|nr:matrixin family metalloprotease [Lactobacillus sp. ESL0785]WEV71044.1 matrixin family metalloprotease [Lactobacillus sp. ESL0785]
MKKLLHFLRKLSCALVAALALSSLATPLNNSPSAPMQIVLAKKSAKKHAAKSIRKIATNQGKDCHWPKKTAKVYIDLDNDEELIAATNDAITAWNNTDTFALVPTNNRKKAQIIIEPMFDPDTDAAGQTGIKYNPKTKVIYTADIQLNVYYLQNFLYNYSYQRVVNTVEHELGHAIGLNHNKEKSVMYPAGSLYPIEPVDIANVKKIYHEQ